MIKVRKLGPGHQRRGRRRVGSSENHPLSSLFDFDQALFEEALIRRKRKPTPAWIGGAPVERTE
jgi:hypothetical protein